MRSNCFFKTLINLAVSLLFFAAQSQANPTIVWEKTYGGSNRDHGFEIIATSDGGYLIIGESESDDGDVAVNKGMGDLWILKIDEEGSLIWEKSYGGSHMDFGQSVVELSNGNGYIVVGSTQSSDGDVTENNFFISWWVLRLDLEGNIIWDKTLGGLGYNRPHSVVQTNDGNIIIAGLNDMDGGDVSVNYGGADFWVVKMDIEGNLIWDKSFGGSGDDIVEKIIKTRDGDFLLVGTSNSMDGDISSPQGMDDNDFWVVKMDMDGNLVWEKSYGGSGGGMYGDWATAVVESSEGGFVVVGHSSSTNGQVTGNHAGTEDFWVIKIDEEGSLIWEKSYGGFHTDMASAIVQTKDGSYIIAGHSASVDGDISSHHGEWPGFEDVWVIKINGNGDLLWEKSLGGTGLDFGRDIILSREGEIIILAETYSESGDGDVSYNHGRPDIWVVKLKEESTGMAEIEIYEIDIEVYPNPFDEAFHVKLPEGFQGNIIVTDLLGRTIHSEKNINKSIFTWNSTTLSTGVYILSVMDNSGRSATRKIVKR